MNTADAKRILETALICSQQPLQLREMRILFEDGLGIDTIKFLLNELQKDWAQRGVEFFGVQLKLAAAVDRDAQIPQRVDAARSRTLRHLAQPAFAGQLGRRTGQL